MKIRMGIAMGEVGSDWKEKFLKKLRQGEQEE